MAAKALWDRLAFYNIQNPSDGKTVKTAIYDSYLFVCSFELLCCYTDITIAERGSVEKTSAVRNTVAETDQVLHRASLLSGASGCTRNQ